MSYKKIVHSRGNVPFSWEKKPGISKETTQLIATKLLDMEDRDQGFDPKLPPPPCPVAGAKASIHGFSRPVPPPPGGSAFDRRPLLRSSLPKGGLRKQDHDQDPFLAAFEEITKSSVKGSGKSTHVRSDFMAGLRSFFTVVPCKSPRSCAVRDGSLVRVSHQPPYDYDEEGYR